LFDIANIFLHVALIAMLSRAERILQASRKQNGIDNIPIKNKNLAGKITAETNVVSETLLL
jgi:hypothetical protein